MRFCVFSSIDVVVRALILSADNNLFNKLYLGNLIAAN